MSTAHRLDGIGNAKWPHIDRHSPPEFIFITCLRPACAHTFPPAASD